MAQERNIVPNLYTSGGEFKLKSAQNGAPGEEYIGSFHYDVDLDRYYTFSTPEIGLQSSEEIVLIDPNMRDENGYLIAPYNVKKNYMLKLSRKKYEDVREVIDTTITELAPDIPVVPELTIEERIELLKGEFSDLKVHMFDQDLDLLIRESLLEHSTILTRGFTDEVVLNYMDIGHFGVEMKGSSATAEEGELGDWPFVTIKINNTIVFSDQIAHDDYRWYNFTPIVSQEDEQQMIEINFNNDVSNEGGDRNVFIRAIKNQVLPYHRYAINPDIVEVDTIIIPQVTSSEAPQGDGTANEMTMVPEVPYDHEQPYAGYEENYFEIRNEDTDSEKSTLKDFFGNDASNTNVRLYDVDGIAEVNKYPNDVNSYAGKFKGVMRENGTVKFDLKTDWFQQSLPPTPIEFTTDDFQIGNIKNTKIDLTQTQLQLEMQETAIEELKRKLNQENEEFEARAEAAEAVSGSQAAQIQAMKASIKSMSEKYFEEWNGKFGDEERGYSMRYNARLEASTTAGAPWAGSQRPKFWYADPDYQDSIQDNTTADSPLMIPKYLGSGGPLGDVHAYPMGDGEEASEGYGRIRMDYYAGNAPISPEGWPNEKQRIGIRAKANSYRGWPRIKIYNKGAPGNDLVGQVSIDSYEWKIYWVELNLGDVGIENKNIELFFKFDNDDTSSYRKRKWWGKKYRVYRHDVTGHDRDVWISHLVRTDGYQIPLAKEYSPYMDSSMLRTEDGQDMAIDGNEETYKYMRAQWVNVNNTQVLTYQPPYRRVYGHWHWWNPWHKRWVQSEPTWPGRLPPAGKLDNNGGIRVTIPATSEWLFEKLDEATVGPNKLAHITLGGLGEADNAGANGIDNMNDRRGIYILPYHRYKLEFCAHIEAGIELSDGTFTTSETQASNNKFAVRVADTRNGAESAPNPYPGTKGYAWEVYQEFEAEENWKKFEMNFEGRPGLQGGTKVYVQFVQGVGDNGEPQRLWISEIRIYGPFEETTMY